ncbi:hypothetical protein JTB14_017177 [Gonioctena quinquepunctata]|nr:hypothetical protein JTB14_017177 [Gonioctena quinquepunctata]
MEQTGQEISITKRNTEDKDGVKKADEEIIKHYRNDRIETVPDKGRSTHAIIKTVGTDLIDTNWKTSQMITGHGHMQKNYYHRFKLRQTNGLFRCGYETVDQQHIMTNCNLEARARNNLIETLRKKNITFPSPRNLNRDIIIKIINNLDKWGNEMIFDDEE